MRLDCVMEASFVYKANKLYTFRYNTPTFRGSQSTQVNIKCIALGRQTTAKQENNYVAHSPQKNDTEPRK